MAQVTAEQLLRKIQTLGGRIAELEVINEALMDEAVALATRLDILQAAVGGAADAPSQDPEQET